MGRFLNPGNSGFERIVNEKIYVDKTGIISYPNEWINTSTDIVSDLRIWGQS